MSLTMMKQHAKPETPAKVHPVCDETIIDFDSRRVAHQRFAQVDDLCDRLLVLTQKRAAAI